MRDGDEYIIGAAEKAAFLRDGFVHLRGVLAEEGRSGTAALLATPDVAGAVLVKAAMPGQDRRVDLPTIGPRTVDAATRGGLRGIAVEAGETLVLERAATLAAADAAGLFVYGISR